MWTTINGLCEALGEEPKYRYWYALHYAPLKKSKVTSCYIGKYLPEEVAPHKPAHDPESARPPRKRTERQREAQ